tara:strand:+ start:241 stop:528 length:288 start_codon:yes stop_codon:yes gene_type:complete
MICLTLVKCTTSASAQEIVDSVEAGNLWGVSMGTTSRASSYSNFVLIESTKTRNYSILESGFDESKFDIQISQIDVDSFTESDIDAKAWFLRGML